MGKLVDTLVHNKSSFTKMSICALMALAGSLLATAASILWLVGDTTVVLQAHHLGALIGLVVSLGVEGAAMLFFYQSINIYRNTYFKKSKEHKFNKTKVCKQTEVIMHLNHRIDELEARLNKEGK